MRRALMIDYAPMKAVLSDQPFDDPRWIFERKLDGIRCGVVRRDGAVRLISRSGQALNDAYPELEEALAVDGPDVVADGEIVAFDRGQTSFSRLQGRMQIRDRERARSSGIAVFYYLFDILERDGEDLRPRPLTERKRALRESIDFRDHLRYTTHRVGKGTQAYTEACRRGWEGVIAKRADSPYASSRSRDWLKLKCSRGQELVIGGWTAPKGSRQRLGALLVGYYEGDALRYAGKVGTGFDDATLQRLGDELERRERDTPPFVDDRLPRAQWAEPELVAQVAFTEWTRDGRLRHPRYEGLREDKPARAVVREEPAA
jgi:DNA ligase D-like protein (predicted ligase)